MDRVSGVINRVSGSMRGETREQRVILYSHDTFGLGHLRRSRALATALTASNPNASAIILTGSPVAGRLEGLRVNLLLDGHRGRSPADREALAAAIVSLSDLAFHLGDGIQALDVNPLIAHRDGCVAVDALVIPRAR